MRLTDQYCVDSAAASWVVNLFVKLLSGETDVMPAASEENGGKPVYSFIAIGTGFTVALRRGGTMYSHGLNDHFQCDVSGWSGIVSVACGNAHTIGLKNDGRVLAAGLNSHNQCDVSELTDIAGVYAFNHATVCVKKDGGVVVKGKCDADVSHFNQIKSIARFPEGIFGIRSDGTVMVSAPDTELDAQDGNPADSSQAEERSWAESLTDVKQIISTYINGSIVLKNNGRIYKMGKPDNYFAQWDDINAIESLSDYFVVLKNDGTVRILAYDRDKPRKPSEADTWQDIVMIYGKFNKLIGLTRYGELKYVATDSLLLKKNKSLQYLADWEAVGWTTGFSDT
ncbi:MAG: RCC1 domain-containing protein [Defluviitaleaceae bacterium]|nr:RCC1 domain-containing protein [Defluviitaleaceae bacterium]